MNVLITGANGFVGKNLTQRLYTIRDRRDRTRPALQIDEIFLCTRQTTPEELQEFCRSADFVGQGYSRRKGKPARAKASCVLFQKIARLAEYTLMRMMCSVSALARSPRYQFTAVVFP